METNDFETELKAGFLEEAVQLLGDTEQCFLDLERSAKDPILLDKLFRLAHNLKGSARAVGFAQMAEFTHELESLLLKLKNGSVAVNGSIVSLMLRCKDHLESMIARLRENPGSSTDNGPLLAELIKAQTTGEFPSESHPEPTPVDSDEALLPVPSPEPAVKAPAQAADESIRVSLARVEKLVNFVGELVILQTVLHEQQGRQEPALFGRTIRDLSKVTKEIQSLSMSLRMVPLKQTFQKMQRIVRDTSMTLGKKVRLQIQGDDTELDKAVLENINDPLVHLIRNAVDHGIESAEKRNQSGKPETGTISLSAFQQADHIMIEVRDDGSGLDPEKIRSKAIEKGIITESQGLSVQETLQLIFRPGFSTKSEVTDISGRGVGLDVVKTNIETILHGEVGIESNLGSGTIFRITLPLTLAIADGMVVKVGNERYVIPLSQVHETLRPDESLIHPVTSLGDILNLRGKSIPLFRLSGLLRKKAEQTLRKHSDSIAIIVHHGQKSFGVLVDDIVGKQQVVIKRLGLETRGLPGFSGSAILGDGCPGLILDLPTLIWPNSASKSHGKAKPAQSSTQ